MADSIDPRVVIGHVHLKVADLDRAVAFYAGVLGFQVTSRNGDSAAFLSAGGYHHHIWLNTWESRNGPPPPSNATGLYHVAIRYPDRATLGAALKRLVDARVPLEGAADHGTSEALYLRDPDGNGIELYRDRPKEQWSYAPDGSVVMRTDPLDVDALLREAGPVAATAPAGSSAPSKPPEPVTISPATRERLSELRTRLLALHKSLLDDARVAYEMDRGSVSSKGHLLQLVISDPFFAWLHQISEMVVRIDEATASDATSTEADARAIFDQLDRRLLPSEHGDIFARRYYEALQRQPAVVLAHGAVKKVLKQS